MQPNPTPPPVDPTSPTWAVFSAFPAGAAHEEWVPPWSRANRYRVDEVRGPGYGISPGGEVLRIESHDATVCSPSANGSTVPALRLCGVTQHLQYTSEPQRASLTARSRAELPAGGDTVAVLIPIRKSASWWQLAQDRRNAHFRSRGSREGHTAVGSRYAERIFRKLYHARYGVPRSPFDFLTYFEFPASERAVFEALLQELRALPEWSYVEAELEVWMSKLA